MKAIRVKDKSDIGRAEKYFTDAILFDAFSPEKYGGTGISFDWNIMGHISKLTSAAALSPSPAKKTIRK
jgi:phosphoribosylanthranilate isomerase